MSTSVPESPSLARQRPFVLFWLARLASTMGYQMLAVTIGWQVYELTDSAFDLGLVGLIQFVPAVVLTLLITASIALVTFVRAKGPAANREPPTLASVLAGFEYIRSSRRLLGVITLDLFVVLLGGAASTASNQPITSKPARDREKAGPGLDPGWKLVFGKDHAQI